MSKSFEVFDLIKEYHQTHNGLRKAKMASHLLYRLSEIEKEAKETHGTMQPWFPDLIYAYWQYHRALTGLDKLKWQAYLDEILESIEKEDLR